MSSRIRLLALVLCLLGACARRSPHGVAERYLEDLEQFDYPAAYHLLSEQDRSARSLEEFMTEIPLAPEVTPVWFRPVLHQTHYELGDAERSGQSAMVPVKITAPDLALWERRLDATAGPSGVSIEEARHSLDSGDYPKLVYDDKIFLIKEHHHWRVVAGFGPREKVVDQHQHAMSNLFTVHYDESIAQWESMIKELRSQAASGSWGLANRYQSQLDYLERLKAAIPAANAYAAELKLDDVAMKMSEDRVPAIFGSVVNGGKRAIDDLVLAVTWYEGRGKDLKAVRREEHVIVAMPIEFTEFADPIRPFIPGESRRFGFVLRAPAEIEASALPYVTIAALALTEPSAPLPRPTIESPRAIPSSKPTPLRTPAPKP